MTQISLAPMRLFKVKSIGGILHRRAHMAVAKACHNRMGIGIQHRVHLALFNIIPCASFRHNNKN